MKPIKILFALFFMMSIGLSAQQRQDYSKYPGYFNYKDIPGLKNAESLSEVYIEDTLLKMISGMAENKSDDMSEMLGGLHLIQVNEYKIDQNSIADMQNSIESIDKSMQAKNWDRIVKTKSKGDYTNIYIMKTSAGEFAGLAIISLSRKEKNEDSATPYGKLTCVNIVGKIDMSKIGKLTKELNLPGMEGLKKKEKNKEDE